MRIFTDLHLQNGPLAVLREGITPHELVISSRPSTSVLALGEPDPAISSAEIIFGQPDARATLAAPQLQWVHLSTAGYARYDTAEFRAAALERGLILTNSSGVYAEP